MDQNPIIGWLKVAAFAILAWVVWMTVWQGSKLEDKIVGLERTVSESQDRARENESLLAKIAANNELLTDLIVEAGIGKGGAPAAGNGGAAKKPVRTGRTSRKQEWGWHLNEGYDSDLDPSRPLGTPGRYKNFLTLDPDRPQVYEGKADETATFNLTWGSEPRGFNFVTENYATLSDSCQLYIMDAVAGRHWKKPSSFNQSPGLAWRVEVNEDFTEYTIFFRRDAKWHMPPGIDLDAYPHLKGDKPVTAKDLHFTLSVIKDPQSDAPVQRAYYDELKSWDLIDDHTIVLRWSKTQFTSISASLNSDIMPRFIYGYNELGEEYPSDTVAAEFNNHWYDKLRIGPAGCGPYRFMKYEPNKFIRLERYEDYWGFKEQPRFKIKSLVFRIYTQPDTAMNWLRGGEVDLSGLNAARYREWILEETSPKSPFKDGRIRLRIEPRTGYLYIGWKNSDPMFEDKRVRQALTYACNRKEICEKIFLNRYAPMAAPIFPDSEEANPNLQPYGFDIEKAKQLLDDADWKLNAETGVREKMIKGELTPFSFKLYWPGPSPEFNQALNHYKNDLQNIGIKMEPVSVQWAQFQTQLRDREYKAFSLLWVVGGWEHDFRQIWHSDMIEDPASSNYIEFRNEELDSLQDRLRTLMDPKERIKVIHRIGEILYEEQPYTFFAWQKTFQASWTYVKGVDRRYYIRPFFRAFPLGIDR
ncbi:MAG: ABC transporter substrate-binding protein [Planctomycetota bacterium]|jgi:peptide/nickel transport system substrate-binding protein